MEENAQAKSILAEMILYMSEKRVHMEITTRCRLACLRCDRTFLNDKKELVQTDLSMEVIERYAASDFERMILCGSYGDPIYHPHFLEAIKVFKNAGKAIDIHTNGSGKKLSWWKELLSILDERDEIYFAIDGLDDTLSNYRINYTKKDFDQFLKIVEISKEYKCVLSWIFIVFRFNEHQIEDVKMLANKIGINLTLRKSARWYSKDDPLMPLNKEWVSSGSIV